MTFFLSDLHNDLRAARLTHRGRVGHPDATARGIHKKYPRMEQVPLPAPARLACSLDDALAKRNSAARSAAEQKPLSLVDLGTLFGHALGRKTHGVHRHYPSGGALYPIETYLITSAIEGAESGVFHYNPTDHLLERLWNIPSGLKVSELARGGPKDLDFSSLIVFTSVWGRSAVKYGDFTYILALLETGHMSENVLLTASALNLHTRPLAGFDDERITTLLDIDSVEEQPIQTIALIKPDAPTNTTEGTEFYEEYSESTKETPGRVPKQVIL